MEISRQVADILLSIEAVKISLDPPFTWTSGIKSPVYCDNRKIISHVIERGLVVDAFVQTIREKQMNPDVIAGTATAAIPWAAFVAQEMKLPMIYIRPEKKAYGAGKQIEGDLMPGQRVLIVEDLISTGGSSIKSAEAVKLEGKCKVTDVIAIMTWELDKAVEEFKSSRLHLTTLTGFSALIGLAKEKCQITQEQAEIIAKFRENPGKWGQDNVGISS